MLQWTSLNVCTLTAQHSSKGRLCNRNFWVKVFILFKCCYSFNCSPCPQKPLMDHLLRCTSVHFLLVLIVLLKPFLLRRIWSFNSLTIMLLWSKIPPQMYLLIQPIRLLSHGFCKVGKWETVSTLLLVTNIPKYRALKKLYPECGLNRRYRRCLPLSSGPNLKVEFLLAILLSQSNDEHA